MARPVFADQPGPVHGDEHWLVVLADVVDGLVEGTLEEGRIERNDRAQPAHGQAGRQRHRMLLGDPDIEEPVRELRLEPGHSGPRGHARGDPDDAPVRSCELDQLGGEDGRVVGDLAGRRSDALRRRGVVGHRFGGHRAAAAVVVGTGCHRDRRQGRAVKSDLIGLGRTKPAALLGANMDDRGTRQCQCLAQRLEKGMKVVARHNADVGDPEILEELARLGEVDHGLAQTPAELQDRGPHDRDSLDNPVVGALALAPRDRELDLREVLGERPDRRADRHLVVVEDDQHLRLAVADVVERLE